MPNQMDREAFEFNKRNVAANERSAKALVGIHDELKALRELAEIVIMRLGWEGDLHDGR